jgi:hypothetical protein
VLAFLIALAVYFVAYTFIEHRRNRKGPWQVTFTNGPAGAPGIVINQPTLQITDVEITFPGNSAAATNGSSTLIFSQPRQVPYEVPFGRCIFMDTTFLPGTLTFQFFGHEIELLPRVLIIDHQEHPWHSESKMILTGDENRKSEQ